MHKQLLFFFISFVAKSLAAQTTIAGSFVHDSITRTYSFYVPASYVPGQPVPLLFNLHGAGTDGSYQEQNRDFRPISDTANFIIVHPDGSFAPNSNQRFWNYGNVLSSTVDDVGFIETLIDTISAHYSINQNRIYCVGMSNGGFMSYAMACESNRFAAVGSVTGSMSVAMYNNCNPSHPTPAIHIHGTGDPINPYAGNSTSKGIEDVTRFWVNENGCDTTPLAFPVTDADPNDDATAVRYLYPNGINGNTVEHFKVDSGGHAWPGQYVFTFFGNTCMDFDASAEVWRFFSQYELPPVGMQSLPDASSISIYPNPAQETVTVVSGDEAVNSVVICDMQGRVIQEASADNIQSINVSQLPPGNYIMQISGEYFFAVKKLVISARQ
jgi:polyhydroxybutyrate depolymerase